MNKDTVQGDWKIMKGKIKQAWGKLTDDQIDRAEGNLDTLEGEIQKSYGLAKKMLRKNTLSGDQNPTIAIPSFKPNFKTIPLNGRFRIYEEDQPCGCLLFLCSCKVSLSFQGSFFSKDCQLS